MPNSKPLEVKLAEPVPPLPTGSVPVTSLVRSTLTPKEACSALPETTKPVPEKSFMVSPPIMMLVRFKLVKVGLAVVLMF